MLLKMLYWNLRKVNEVLADNKFLKAPWTKEQVENINSYQTSGFFHPYTCDFCREVLIAEEEGWVCVCGKHKQDWCCAWTAEFDESSAEYELQRNLKIILNKSKKGDCT